MGAYKLIHPNDTITNLVNLPNVRYAAIEWKKLTQASWGNMRGKTPNGIDGPFILRQLRKPLDIARDPPIEIGIPCTSSGNVGTFLKRKREKEREEEMAKYFRF